MYAIAQLIHHELATRGWRMSTLVTAMGYKNVSRGLKRLNGCIQDGDCSNIEMISRLRNALDLPTDHLNDVIAETRRQRAEEDRVRAVREEAERRAKFRPYVYVCTSERRPTFISAAAVIGPRLKYIQLDDAVVTLPRPLLLSKVSVIVREHYRSNLGKCLLFGDITGYAFRITYDETAEFTIDGTLVKERHGWTEDEWHAMLLVGKHVISEGLFGIAV